MTDDVGKCLWGIDWSRDRWRHMTLKGQVRDPKMFGGHFLENGWRYSLGYNRAPIGNGIWGIKWSHDRWCQWSVNRDLGMFGREIGSLEKKSRQWTDCVFVRTLSCFYCNLFWVLPLSHVEWGMSTSCQSTVSYTVVKACRFSLIAYSRYLST